METNPHKTETLKRLNLFGEGYKMKKNETSILNIAEYLDNEEIVAVIGQERPLDSVAVRSLQTAERLVTNKQ